jgi:hypothetical protein
MRCLSLLSVSQGISDGMSCAVNEARLAVDVGYWPLYRYTPETDLPTTTDEVSLHLRHSIAATSFASLQYQCYQSQGSGSMVYWTNCSSSLLRALMANHTHACLAHAGGLRAPGPARQADAGQQEAEGRD